MTYDEPEALELYLQSGRARISSFWAVLRDARNTTGRDPEMGTIVSPENTGTWLGAIGYLSFMDQVGTALIPEGAEDAGDKSIVECLRHFTDVGPRTKDALYALRNALVHDYSLFNRHHRPERQHLFALVNNSEDPLIAWPDEPWDGDFTTPVGRKQWTVVNLEALGDLVEERVYLNVLGARDNGTLRINQNRDRIEGGPDELVRRYTFLDMGLGPPTPDDDLGALVDEREPPSGTSH